MLRYISCILLIGRCRIEVKIPRNTICFSYALKYSLVLACNSNYALTTGSTGLGAGGFCAGSWWCWSLARSVDSLSCQQILDVFLVGRARFQRGLRESYCGRSLCVTVVIGGTDCSTALLHVKLLPIRRRRVGCCDCALTRD